MIFLGLFAIDKFIKTFLISINSKLYINDGVLLGFSVDSGIVLIVSLIVVILIVFCYLKFFDNDLSIKLIAIGALMNISDRFIWGGVVDYINIFGILIINIADVIILVGIIYLIYLKYIDKKRYLIKS